MGQATFNNFSFYKLKANLWRYFYKYLPCFLQTFFKRKPELNRWIGKGREGAIYRKKWNYKVFL